MRDFMQIISEAYVRQENIAMAEKLGLIALNDPVFKLEIKAAKKDCREINAIVNKRRKK